MRISQHRKPFVSLYKHFSGSLYFPLIDKKFTSPLNRNITIYYITETATRHITHQLPLDQYQMFKDHVASLVSGQLSQNAFLREVYVRTVDKRGLD